MKVAVAENPVRFPMEASAPTPIDYADTYTRLEAGLQKAAAVLAAAEARAAGVARSKQAATIFAIGSALCASAAAVESLVLGSRLLIVSTAGLTPLGLGLVLASWIAAAARPRAIPLPQVAERLDLAAGDLNAIATALDLANSKEAGTFVGPAIAQGMSALETFGAMPPVLPTMDKRYASSVLFPFLAGLACIAVLLLEPLRMPTRAPDRAERIDQVISVNASAQMRHPNDLPREVPPEPLQVRTSATATSAGTAAPSGAPPAKLAPNAALSAATPSAGTEGVSDIAGRHDDATHPSQSGSKPAPSNDSRPDTAPPPIQAAANIQRLAAFASETPEGVVAVGHATGATAEASDGDDPKSGKPEGAASAQKGAGGAPPANKQKAQKGDTASSPGDNLGKGKRAGSGHANGIPDLNAASGSTGQGSGQNAPKKARGVPPLLLGTPMPDQIKGSSGPGPDTRSKSQTPPSPMAGDPDPAVAAQPRLDAEPSVPTFRVPGELQGTVNTYFERLHDLDSSN